MPAAPENPSKTGNEAPLSPDLAPVLGRLACPVCYAVLEIQADHLACTGCGRAYPILDGIPVLIASEESPTGEPSA